MRNKLVLFIIILFFFSNFKHISLAQTVTTNRFWNVQSIDTMKYSRDTAREKANSKSFEEVIKKQVKDIADTGATHVGISTPYDSEFIPYLTKWVNAARDNNLNVWFRGNFSGWEGWFEYPEISREEHLNKTYDFILANPELFKDGDIFTPCPECENGGDGDPRQNATEDSVKKYRKFLTDSNKIAIKGFKEINKKVKTNYFSMNGDVLSLIMDKSTADKMDSIVAVDHYVKTPTQLNNDVTRYAQASEARVVLGEMGVPIPDIHGDMTQEEQSEWLKEALTLLSQNPNVEGINYWVNTGGSTQIWLNDRDDQNNEPTLAVQTLTAFFKPQVATVRAVNELDEPVLNGTLSDEISSYKPKEDGVYSILYVYDTPTVKLSAPGYEVAELKIDPGNTNTVVLKKMHEDLWFKIRKYIKTKAF